MIATSTKIRKTQWTGLELHQVKAVLRRLGVEGWDIKMTLKLIREGTCGHMSTGIQRPEDGSRAFALIVTDQGCGEYDITLDWSLEYAPQAEPEPVADVKAPNLAVALRDSLAAATAPWWAVCFDFASGPYSTELAAQSAIAQFPDCQLTHRVVQSATRPETELDRVREAHGETGD